MVGTLLRWLAVPVALAALAALGVGLAFALVFLADGRCVDAVGGACVEPWHTTAVEGAILVAVACVLLTMPGAAARIAPAARRVVPLVVALLGAGTVWAFSLATGWSGLGPLLLVATLAAGLGARIALRAPALAAPPQDPAT